MPAPTLSRLPPAPTVVEPRLRTLVRVDTPPPTGTPACRLWMMTSRGLTVMRVAPFPDHRRRGLAIDVMAGMPAVDDDVVAAGGSHPDCRAAAAMNRNARAAGTLTHRRAATALHLVVGCGLAAGRIARGSVVAAVALA